MPLFHAVEALKSGQLNPILPGWRRPSVSCFVYAPEDAFEKRRVRALFDRLAERSMLAGLKRTFPQFYR